MLQQLFEEQLFLQPVVGFKRCSQYLSAQMALTSLLCLYAPLTELIQASNSSGNHWERGQGLNLLVTRYNDECNARSQGVPHAKFDCCQLQITSSYLRLCCLLLTALRPFWC